MARSKKFSEIVERIEYVRNYLGLNKSRFSAEIGLKPQTYNNFIGSQGSKPSVDLILGIVDRFGANPNWILNGKGPVFLELPPEQEQRLRPPAGTESIGWRAAHVAEGPGAHEAAGELAQRFAGLESRVREMERRMEWVQGGALPLVREIVDLLRRLHEQDPDAAERAGREVRGRLEEWMRERS